MRGSVVRNNFQKSLQALNLPQKIHNVPEPSLKDEVILSQSETMTKTSKKPPTFSRSSNLRKFQERKGSMNMSLKNLIQER